MENSGITQFRCKYWGLQFIMLWTQFNHLNFNCPIRNSKKHVWHLASKVTKELYLIIPYFNQTVICTWNEVWFVATTVVINAIDAFLMSLQSEVWWGRAQLPYLQRTTAFASQYADLLFRRQLYHTSDILYKMWKPRREKLHCFSPEFPWGQNHYGIIWKCQFPGFNPQRLWFRLWLYNEA